MRKVIYKYIKIKSDKKIHNWYPGKRECTSERMLLNPYIGCEGNCFFCYAKSYPGNFQKSRKEKLIFIYENFVENLKNMIEKIEVAFCGYLSPVSDPFQPAEKIFKLSEKTIEFLIDKNIPIEFITKFEVPESVIEKIKLQKHSFGQISILTTDENLRKKLMSGGTETEKLFKNIEKLAKNDIFSVCRIDPIIPFITDNKKNLYELIKKAINHGAKHIVASIMDIPQILRKEIITYIKNNFGYEIAKKIDNIYTEKIGTWFHANINYRKMIFSFLRESCDKLGISFALCMEYELKNGKITGMNKEFMSSRNCEGIDIPIYFRKNNSFFPFSCFGDCLNCKYAKCGINDLAQGNKLENFKGWNYYDYIKWSKKIRKELV